VILINKRVKFVCAVMFVSCLALIGLFIYDSQPVEVSKASDLKEAITIDYQANSKAVLLNHSKKTTNDDFQEMLRPTVQEISQAQESIDEKRDEFVGDLEIPAIDLSLFILQGTTFENMLYGATTVLPSQVMGQGNYALASHNMGVEGAMFTSIHKLKKGDDIFLHDGGKTYRYKVVKNYVTTYKDTACLNATDKATITLITCDSVHETDKRVIIQGELQK
jgi:sortase A